MIGILSIIVFVIVIGTAAYFLVKNTDTPLLKTEFESRFVYGVPWVTLVTIIGLVGVFLFIQSGHKPSGATVVGFRSWSITYPQGWIFSSFAHLDTGHITSNVIWLLVFGGMVEYSWSHYPRNATKTETSSNQARESQVPVQTPSRRIALLLSIIILYSVGSSLVIPGATIGFSGVVFVLIGIIVVIRPTWAIAGVVTARILQELTDIVFSPVVVERRFVIQVTAGVGETSLQGHLVGFLVGVLLGAALLRVQTRMAPPSVTVWLAGITIAVFQSLHEFSFNTGSNQVVIFQAIGASAIVLLMVCIAYGISVPNRPLISRIDLSLHEATLGFVLAIVLAFALVGLTFSFVAIDDENQNGIEIEDYTVWYTDGTPNQYESQFPVGITSGETGNVSGVLITSPERTAWHVAATPQELRREETMTVPVGDAFFREEVTINRSSWNVVGNGTVYTVTGTTSNQAKTVLYDSQSRQSIHRVNNTQFYISVDNGIFYITAETEPGRTTTKRVPDAGQRISLNWGDVVHADDKLYAVNNESRVLLANRGY